MIRLNASGFSPNDEPVNFQVVKIGNIPWEVSTQDICKLIEPHLWRSRPSQDWVHIPIDRTTGKTLSELFVEVPTIFEAQMLCDRLDKIILKQRAISLAMSSYEELVSVLVTPVSLSMGTYLTREDVTGVIDICRNYKALVNRLACLLTLACRFIFRENARSGPLSIF